MDIIKMDENFERLLKTKDSSSNNIPLEIKAEWLDDKLKPFPENTIAAYYVEENGVRTTHIFIKEKRVEEILTEYKIKDILKDGSAESDFDRWREMTGSHCSEKCPKNEDCPKFKEWLYLNSQEIR